MSDRLQQMEAVLSAYDNLVKYYEEQIEYLREERSEVLRASPKSGATQA
jgi:hypothetical protein